VTKGLHEFKFKEACTMTGVVVNNAGVIRSRDNSNLLRLTSILKGRCHDNEILYLRTKIAQNRA